MGFGQQSLVWRGATFPEVSGHITTKKVVDKHKCIAMGNIIVDNFVIEKYK